MAIVPSRAGVLNAAAMDPLQTGASSLIESQQQPRDVRRCRLFPIRVLACFPCLSSTFTVIQDWLHLVLVLGVLASFGCIFQMVLELALRGNCNSAVCINRWLAGLCIMPSLFWFIVTIRQYDQELKDKKRDRQREVQGLIDTHNRQAEEMNECCRQIADNANDFAEGRFNDKARAFIRFLRNVPRDRDTYSEEEMLKELRHFVVMWFHTFSGALLNPESNPVWANVEQEVRSCTTVENLCETAIKRVNAHTVAFKCQVPADTPLIEERDTEHSEASGALDDLEAAEKKCGVTWLRIHCCKKATRLLQNRPVTYAEMRQTHQHLDDAQLLAEWQSLRRVWGFGCQRSPSESGMPFEIMFGCGKLRVLSGMHIKFLLLVIWDLLLMAFEAYNLRWVNFFLVTINEICAVCILACFEQINEIAVLEREINFFKERVTEINHKHTKAQRDWDQVKQLHELWKYRTLPTLSVMHKVTDYLEDKVIKVSAEEGSQLQDDFDTPAAFLQFANQSIDCLDRKLGTLQEWRDRTTPLDEEWKETIGKQLRNTELSADKDLVGTLSQLPIITKDLRALDAAPPSQSPRLPSRSSSIAGSFAGSPSGSFVASPSGSIIEEKPRSNS